MTAIFQFEITWDGAAAFGGRDRQKAGRRSMEVAGEAWHRLFKPRKFSPNASQIYRLRLRGRRYRSAKRSRSVNGQGDRAIGLDRPFVWSGVTMRLALAGKKVTARAPSAERHYADIIINAPQLNRKPWVRQEMERINSDELDVLDKAAAKTYRRFLTTHGRKVRRRSK